jgi:hypothetical protein
MKPKTRLRLTVLSFATVSTAVVFASDPARASNVEVRVEAKPTNGAPEFKYEAFLPELIKSEFFLTAGNPETDSKVFEDIVPESDPIGGPRKSLPVTQKPVHGWVLEEIRISVSPDRVSPGSKHIGNREGAANVRDALETITITFCNKKAGSPQRVDFKESPEPRANPISTVVGRSGEINVIEDDFYGVILGDLTGSSARTFHTPSEIPAFVPDPADVLRNLNGGERIAALNAAGGTGAAAILRVIERFLPPPPFPRARQHWGLR